MGRLLSGTLLLLLGCVFLLANLGYISWDVVEQLAKLWPLLLVAWGIGLMTRGSKLSFLGFLGPLILVVAVCYTVWGHYHGRTEDVRSLEVFQELTDIDEAEVTIRFAGGKLNLRAGDTLNLIEADLDYRADSATPKLVYYEEDGMGRAVLRRRGNTHSGPGMGNRWDVRLSDQIPLEMRVVSEGATCSLDLDGLQVSDLDLSVSASRLNARLGRGDMDGAIKLEAAVSSVNIEIPKSYGVRLVLGCDLCWKDLPDGMKKRPGGGGAYYSENYDRAPYRMDVDVDAAVSKIAIEQY